MADPPKPSEIARREFEVVRRGFDQQAVRGFLHEVSALVERLQRDEAELTERATKAERRLAAAEHPDEASMLELLGEETTRVLTSAHDAAADIRAKAEQAAERIIAEASAQAAQTRSGAVEEADKRLAEVRAEGDKILASARTELERRSKEAEEAAERIRAEGSAQAQAQRDEAQRVLADAKAEAAAIVEAAKEEGRGLVEDAQALRERVLKDLSTRRKKARLQIEQLNAGRERLLQAYDVVRSTVQEATDELASSVTDARLAAAAAARRIELEPEATVDELDAELAAARIVDLPVAEPPPMVKVPKGRRRREEEQATGATEVQPEPTPEPEPSEPAAAPTPTPAPAPEPAPAAAPAPTAEPVRLPPPTPAPGPGPRPPASRPAPPPVHDLGDFGPITEPAPAPVAPPPPAAPAASAPAVAAPAATPAGEPAPPDVAKGEPEPEPTPAPAPAAAPAAAPEPSGPKPGPADDVFARLRDGAEGDATADGPPKATSKPKAKGKGKATAAADAAAEAEAAASPWAEAFEARAAAIEPIERDLARSLKRTLADEQNEVLDKLRRTKPSGVDDLLPPADEHRSRWSEVARATLTEAAAAGALGSGGGKSASVKGLADDLAEGIVAPLRERIDRSFTASDGNLDDVADRVRALYREWKNQKLPEAVPHHVAAAYAKGRFDALPSGAKVQWVVDPMETACPDCDDNVLAGAIAKGEEFPTGGPCAPAHPGCRCLVLPADT